MSIPAPTNSRADTPRIMIRGFGLITPLAHSAWETFSALLAGRSIADRAARLPDDVAPIDLVRAIGGVSIAQHAAADPAAELAERAAREALFMAGVDGEGMEAILGASKGAVGRGAFDCRVSIGDRQKHAAASRSSPQLETRNSKLETLDAPPFPHANLADHLRARLKLADITCTVAACASSLTALHQARLKLLHAGPDGPKRVLVVTSEAALYPLFIHSYHRLGVLPPLCAAEYRGRPLDAGRNGFMLAELGAAVLLERDDGRESEGIELLDTAVAAEGHDLIRIAPGMPALSRVAKQLMGGRKIDALHPHATGTIDNDEAEMGVYEEVISDFGFRISDGGEGTVAPSSKSEIRNPKSEIPQLYANKGALGHGLGAAGLVSLVIACLCAKTNRIPPMPWLKDPIPSATPFFKSEIRNQKSEMKTHAIFSAGFGGHVAGALIRKT